MLSLPVSNGKSSFHTPYRPIQAACNHPATRDRPGGLRRQGRPFRHPRPCRDRRPCDGFHRLRTKRRVSSGVWGMASIHLRRRTRWGPLTLRRGTVRRQAAGTAQATAFPNLTPERQAERWCSYSVVWRTWRPVVARRSSALFCCAAARV